MLDHSIDTKPLCRRVRSYNRRYAEKVVYSVMNRGKMQALKIDRFLPKAMRYRRRGGTAGCSGYSRARRVLSNERAIHADRRRVSASLLDHLKAEL